MMIEYPGYILETDFFVCMEKILTKIFQKKATIKKTGYEERDANLNQMMIPIYVNNIQFF